MTESNVHEIKTIEGQGQRRKAAIAAACNAILRQSELLPKPRRYLTEADGGIALSMIGLLLDVAEVDLKTELVAPQTQPNSAEGVGAAAVAEVLAKIAESA